MRSVLSPRIGQVLERRVSLRRLRLIIVVLLVIAVSTPKIMGQQSGAALILEAYSWPVGGTIAGTLKNVGQGPIDIGSSDFFINGIQVTASMTLATLASQQESDFEFIYTGGTVVAGAAYSLQIVTPSGDQFSYSIICGGASGQPIAASTSYESSYTQIQSTNTFTTSSIIQAQVSPQTQPGTGDFFVNNAFLMIGAVAVGILLISTILGVYAISAAHRNRDRGLYD